MPAATNGSARAGGRRSKTSKRRNRGKDACAASAESGSLTSVCGAGESSSSRARAMLSARSALRGQAVMTDAVEAAGQHMDEEAADELVRGAVVVPLEGDRPAYLNSRRNTADELGKRIIQSVSQIGRLDRKGLNQLAISE